MRCDTTGTGWRLKAKASISPCDSHFSPEIFLLFNILIFWYFEIFCCSLSLSLLSKWVMHCIANVICSSLFFFQLCLWSRVCKVGSLHGIPLTLAWSSIVVLQNYIIPVFQWCGIPTSAWLLVSKLIDTHNSFHTQNEVRVVEELDTFLDWDICYSFVQGCKLQIVKLWIP